MKTKVVAMAVIAVILVLIVGEVKTTSAPAVLRVATTTSLHDTGLWDYLEPIFEKRYDVDLQVLAKGTGIALELGKRGDVDVVTVHDPAQEAAFVADGYAVEAERFDTARVPWAHNYFIIVGPESDPASIGGRNLTPEESFRQIQRAGAVAPRSVKFVSRGDNSGTHGKERVVWAAAGYDYTADIQGAGATAGWYVEAGAGMGATLIMADQLMAYTLTDRGSFLAYRRDLDLVPLVDTGHVLLNVYAVMVCKNGVNSEMAHKLVTFLRAPEIQALIAEFGVTDYGEPIFFPYDPAICG